MPYFHAPRGQVACGHVVCRPCLLRSAASTAFADRSKSAASEAPLICCPAHACSQTLGLDDCRAFLGEGALLSYFDRLVSFASAPSDSRGDGDDDHRGGSDDSRCALCQAAAPHVGAAALVAHRTDVIASAVSAFAAGSVVDLNATLQSACTTRCHACKKAICLVCGSKAHSGINPSILFLKNLTCSEATFKHWCVR